ncbi:type II secretion system protein [Francisella sp. Scap27]|uniref:PilW family protein n=1 Tax=Francisella sp. Scap27 TaxID=2589986 RepID=UPI0015C048D7|nr:type II secretion system protein [Francisella sp. Scap27]QLE78768.1 type II secretion system protein [Francisella sp. Scap27]
MYCFNKNKNNGFSLVELMVASLIAILAFSIAINIYSTIKRQFEDNRNKLDQEVSQLIVKNIISNSIRNSGFACNFGTSFQTQSDATGEGLESFFLGSTDIQVGNLPLSSGSTLPISLESNCDSECFQAGSDYILIKHDVAHHHLINDTSNTTLELDSVDSISANDHLLLCNAGAINLVKALTINSGSSTVTLDSSYGGFPYYTGDYVGDYSLDIFYIKDTGEVDLQGNAIFGLYVYIKGDDASGDGVNDDLYELVRGVENLKVSASLDGETWNQVVGDLNIDKNTYRALEISFEIDGVSYNKIIIL